MSEADIQECEDCVAPAEAFGVVASETRLAILEALWEADERPVRFSALRREVGMRDSAQFNYHLDKLCDHFIVKTDEVSESGDSEARGSSSRGGYDLRHAGKKVVRAVLAGEFNETPTLDPFEVPGECVDCGATLTARYADEKFSIECTECSSLHGRYSFPPGGLADRSREQLVRAFDQRVRHLHCLAADGVCPECSGPMSTELTRDEEGLLDLDVRVDHVCQRCDHRLHSSVGLSLLDQSDVVTAHRAHGIDLGTRPYWTLGWCVSDEYTEVVSEDPWRIRVTLPLVELAEEHGTSTAAGPEGEPVVGDGGRYPTLVCGDGSPPPSTLVVTLDGDLRVVSIDADD